MLTAATSYHNMSYTLLSHESAAGHGAWHIIMNDLSI